MAQQVITNTDISLFLMDRPELNTLIDGSRFTPEMINKAVLYTIDQFNTANPPTNSFYTVESFPSVSLLLLGVCSWLLKSAAIGDAANQFNYSADGVTIQDRDKAQIFLSLGQMFAADFKETTMNLKMNMNVGQCYGGVGSEWGVRAYVV